MPNNGMHPTADTPAFNSNNGLGRRVMPGVRSPECSGLMAQEAQAGAQRRSNMGMHPTRDTTALMYLNRAGGRVMPGVRRRYGRSVRCSEERGWRKTYYGSCGLRRNLCAA